VVLAVEAQLAALAGVVGSGVDRARIAQRVAVGGTFRGNRLCEFGGAPGRVRSRLQRAGPGCRPGRVERDRATCGEMLTKCAKRRIPVVRSLTGETHLSV
jgi:hypothetical protein